MERGGEGEPKKLAQVIQTKKTKERKQNNDVEHWYRREGGREGERGKEMKRGERERTRNKRRNKHRNMVPLTAVKEGKESFRLIRVDAF